MRCLRHKLLNRITAIAGTALALTCAACTHDADASIDPDTNVGGGTDNDSTAEVEWPNFETGDGSCAGCGRGAEVAAAVIADETSIFVVGEGNSWSGPDGETAHAIWKETPEGYLSAFDAEGTYLSHQLFGEAGSVLRTEDSGLIVVGNTCTGWNGPDGELPVAPHPGSGILAPFVIRFSEGGNYLSHTFVSAREAIKAAIREDGGLYIVGNADVEWFGPSGEAALSPPAGSTDIWALSLGPDLEYEWHAFFGSSDMDTVSDVIVTGDQNLLITGTSYTGWNGPSGAPPLNAHSEGKIEFDGMVEEYGQDVFILSLTESGEYLWHTFYGNNSHAGAILSASDGDIFVVGTTDTSTLSPLWVGPEDEAPRHVPTLAPYGTSDHGTFHVLRLNSEGNYEWHTFFGSGGVSGGNAVSATLTSDGGVVVLGEDSQDWLSASDEPTFVPIQANISQSGTMGVVLKIDETGAYQWHTYLGGDEGNVLTAVTAPPWGGIIAVGGAWSDIDIQGPVPLNPHSDNYGSDSYIAALDENGQVRWQTFYGSPYDHSLCSDK